MKVKVLKPIRHKNKTVNVGQIVELDDEASKILIDKKVVEQIKDKVIKEIKK